MYAAEILSRSETLALSNNQVISLEDNGGIFARKKNKNGKKGKTGPFKAIGILLGMIVIFLAFLIPGTIIPSEISDRLIEETDVQYADAVASQKLIFQQALMSGEIPSDTAKNLKGEGVLVGYMENGELIEANKSPAGQELVLKMGDKIITAKNFIKEVDSNINLFDKLDKATNSSYSRAAYYFDEAAMEVFKEIGTNRNNYARDSVFEEVMGELVGEGSDIDINSVSLVQKTRVNEETGKEEVYYEYEENGAAVNSNTEAANLITEVSSKNRAETMNKSTLNTADILKVADTIAKEKRSSLFYLGFMENVSKMKLGEGNNSKINEAMNFLYTKAETEIVDTKTGEVKKASGTPLESPSLYAILSGSSATTEEVKNYSSDRILKIVENQLGTDNSAGATHETVASASNKVKGSIGRLVSSGMEAASEAILKLVEPTVSKSLVKNSVDEIKGVEAGEFLVEGAVNVGKKLAKKSGATAGDAEAILAYSKFNDAALAREAELDRMNRSPFDVTSKNTFLGSIVHNFAVGLQLNSSRSLLLSSAKSLLTTTGEAIASLSPVTHAAGAERYLDNIGDCETQATILAAGSLQCSEVAVFDTSTLDDPFNNPEFVNFVENNTIMDESGTRKVRGNSVLENFLKYNERQTPLGVMDGDILKAQEGSSSSVTFGTNILEMIKSWINSSEDSKRIASGAAFVNSGQNPDWQTYKYAQRYVSLARANEVARRYTNDDTAYHKMKFFEGEENPVVAFMREYYSERLAER